MRNILFKKLKDEKGQNLVEFALVLLLLLVISLGIVEFGRAWFLADRLKNAANIAARTYAVAVTNSQTQARQAAFGVISASFVAYTSPSSVRVEVSRQFQTVVPGILPMLGTITITRDATYRRE